MKHIKDVLVFGAHPDDIEIGCSGTCAKLQAFGVNVKWVVLTSEQDKEKCLLRQKESINAGISIGLNVDDIFFFGECDGKLQCNSETVSRLRSFLKINKLTPDLVIVHTLHDSHGDHRSSNELIKSTFRKAVILEYRVVNSGSASHFLPNIYVDITNYLKEKEQMLKCHVSQDSVGRIMWEDIDEIDRRYSEKIQGTHCEAFSAWVQEGASNTERILDELNDNINVSLWNHLIKGMGLTIVLGRLVPRTDVFYQAGRMNSDWEASHTIRDSILKNKGLEVFIKEIQAGAYDDEIHFKNNSVILIGGSGSNNAVLRYFNHFQSLRYIIDYDSPGYQNLRILDKMGKQNIVAEYLADINGDKVLKKDKGILTIMKNPYNENSLMIGVMGIHGSATKVGASILTKQDGMFDIFSLVEEASFGQIEGFQLVYECPPDGMSCSIIKTYKW